MAIYALKQTSFMTGLFHPKLNQLHQQHSCEHGVCPFLRGHPVDIKAQIMCRALRLEFFLLDLDQTFCHFAMNISVNINISLQSITYLNNIIQTHIFNIFYTLHSSVSGGCFCHVFCITQDTLNILAKQVYVCPSEKYAQH